MPIDEAPTETLAAKDLGLPDPQTVALPARSLYGSTYNTREMNEGLAAIANKTFADATDTVKAQNDLQIRIRYIEANAGWQPGPASIARNLAAVAQKHPSLGRDVATALTNIYPQMPVDDSMRDVLKSVWLQALRYDAAAPAEKAALEGLSALASDRISENKDVADILQALTEAELGYDLSLSRLRDLMVTSLEDQKAATPAPVQKTPFTFGRRP